MHRHKLIWKILPYYLAVIFLSLLLVLMYASQEMKSAYLDQVATVLESRAHLVAEHLQAGGGSEAAMPVDAVCKRLGQVAATRITVIGPDGAVLGDTNEDPVAMENHAHRPEFETALQGGVGKSTRYSNTVQRQMMYVATPFVVDGKVMGCIRTAVPVSEIDEQLSVFRTHVALGGLAMMLLAALVSLLVFRRIGRPLDQLKGAADAYARGELSTRVPVSDIVEVGAVADAMNRMARQLDERINTIIAQRNEQDAVLRSMVEGVVAVDARERVLNLNKTAASFFEVEQDWARGRSIQEVVRNVDLHRFARRALESEEPIEAEIVLEGSQQRFLRAHGSVLRAASGERTGAVLVLNDSTRLRKLEGIRRDFVANVSHELKTPITSIRGFVETLLDGAMENREDTERFLQIIDRQAVRLNAIVEDLLSLSRIEKETERDEIELTPQLLQPILQNATVSCEARASDRNIAIELSCREDLRVVANGRHLEQAVINLIDNAIKYSPDGSAVRVSGLTRDNQIVISVIDQGCGIEARHLPRVFERFYRVDKARSREVGGTGLGLAIVKHIALAHNGSVHVESTPGQGSTFEIRLPLPA